MPTMPVKQFRPDTSNVQILNAIRKNASNLYQSRIPAATKGNLSQTQKRIMDFAPARNEFMDSLVNQIGLILIRSRSWTNKLKEFKRGMLEYGDTIEEIQVGLAQAHTYDSDREYLEKTLFGQHRLNSQSSFHKVNRQNFYAVSVNRAMLQRAFTSDTGLIQLINEIIEAPTTSDELDEFLAMSRMFRLYHDNDGFFNVNVPDVSAVTSTESQAKALLRAIRSYSETLTFISEHYNAAGMPVFAPKNDLVIFLTPEVKAAIDVNALAAAFNVGYAEAESRMVTIPAEQFDIPGTQAILTTSAFFVVADTLFETRTVENAVGLHDNYFLHHHQIISVSRFAPAVRFSTDPTTAITAPADAVTGLTDISVVDRNGSAVDSVERGMLYQVLVSTETEAELSNLDAVELSLQGATSDWSRITNTGTFMLGADEPAASVTITAVASDDSTVTAELSVAASGDVLNLWPNPSVQPAPEEDSGDSGE